MVLPVLDPKLRSVALTLAAPARSTWPFDISKLKSPMVAAALGIWQSPIGTIELELDWVHGFVVFWG